MSTPYNPDDLRSGELIGNLREQAWATPVERLRVTEVHQRLSI
jgi:hypothetical protein